MRFNISTPKKKALVRTGLGGVVLLMLIAGVGFVAFGGTNEQAPGQALGQTATQSSKQNSRVVVEEYLSLTCPHCVVFHREIYPKLAEGSLQHERVDFVYRDFPLDRLALQAAVLARCGGETLRDKLIGAMLERQHKWMRSEQPQEGLFAVVALVGIDRARAQACLEDEALERAVLEEQLAGQKRYKISSTPSIVVAGKNLSGALNQKNIERAIEKSLNAEGL